MKLQRIEQETIINYNAEESTASVYTHHAALMRKLDRLTVERPAECQLVRRLHDGLAAEYIVPKRWIRVNPSRILSDDQRQALAERLHKT